MKEWKKPEMIALDVNMTAGGPIGKDHPDADWTEPTEPIFNPETGQYEQDSRRPWSASGPVAE